MAAGHDAAFFVADRAGGDAVCAESGWDESLRAGVDGLGRRSQKGLQRCCGRCGRLMGEEG